MDISEYTSRTGTQMRKGTLEFCILLIMSKGEVYAGDIITKLRASQQLVVEGTLYPILSRLKRDNLVTYRWEESQSGPPRKYYSLSSDGKKAVKLLSENWNDLSETIKQLISRHV